MSPLVATGHKIKLRTVTKLIFLQPIQQLKYKDGIPGEAALTRILFEPRECSRGRKSQENAYNEGTLN